MRWSRAASLALTLAMVAVGCSSERSQPPVGQDEGTLGSTAAAITSLCSPDTLGLPCDPDGPAGPKLECEGACSITTLGNVSCQPVSAGVNNGVICGTTNGVGDNACKRYCSGKTCLNAPAPAGAACRPTAGSNPCEGQCSSAGVCEAIADPCDYGRREQLCKFDTCTFANATQCVTTNLKKSTVCSDADACSIGSCNVSGVCVAGPTKGCDDGNSCTDDACDPEDGGCTGTSNDSNSCSDGNACMTGEFCSSGACVPGTTPIDCNDSDACTLDTCDPNTGCANVAQSCSDDNACTDDSCDSSDGSCSHTTKTCTDNDPCTVDSCDTTAGCVFTALSCDDLDSCTADSCSAGECAHSDISCDDNDPCTSDSCHAVDGCGHAAIPGCATGAGGEGGNADGNGGAGGDPSTGGVPSDGGTPGSDGGTPGSDGGMPGSQGGTPSSQGGMAGTNPTSGTGPGQSGSNSGGSSTAGTNSSTAGTTTNQGGEDAGTGHRTIQDGGCGCRTAGSPSRAPAGLLMLGIAGLALLRRRRAA